jgi:hypothetical protein
MRSSSQIEVRDETPRGLLGQLDSPGHHPMIELLRLSKRIDLYIPKRIQTKAPKECKVLMELVRNLSEMMVKGEGEELLLEFCWSDWLADLVFACRQ